MPPTGKMLCLVLSAALICSCATPALWEATDPDKFIAVSQEEVSESELQAAGLDYYRNDEKHVYFVEKDSLLKFRDYAFRIVATPFTIVVDVALLSLVAGVVEYVLPFVISGEPDLAAKHRAYLENERQYQNQLRNR